MNMRQSQRLLVMMLTLILIGLNSSPGRVAFLAAESTPPSKLKNLSPTAINLEPTATNLEPQLMYSPPTSVNPSTRSIRGSNPPSQSTAFRDSGRWLRAADLQHEVIGQALVELDPLTLQLKGPQNFWLLEPSGAWQCGANTWEISGTGTSDKPLIYLLNNSGNLSINNAIFQLDLETGKLSRHLNLKTRISGLAQKEDRFYFSEGRMVRQGLSGKFVILPEPVGGLDYVSDPASGENFLLAITSNLLYNTVWKIPLDEAGNFQDSPCRLITIDKASSALSLYPSTYSGISYACIPWEGEMRQVLYLSRDTAYSDSEDEIAIVDFTTGELLRAVCPLESGIDLSEPIVLGRDDGLSDERVICDYLTWSRPQGIQYLDGRLFMLCCLCCKPCQPLITVKKYISTDEGKTFIDADTPPGPRVAEGSKLYFKIVVTNPNLFKLYSVSLTDSQYSTETCQGPEVLKGGASFECIIGPVTAKSGQQTNTAKVTAKCLKKVKKILYDSDPANYFGVAGGSITIQKLTNDQEAKEKPGPFIPVDSEVTWKYIVTNTGEVPLSQVSVIDDQDVTVSCPKDNLAPGEIMTCTASGKAKPGQYTNICTVISFDPAGNTVMASDVSHYFGSASNLIMTKFINDQIADKPPGIKLTVGDPITWTYKVTNTGNVILSNIKVTDDQGVSVICPKDTLEAGQSMTCAASGLAKVGQHENIGSVIATDPDGKQITASSSSYYFGCTCGIKIKKFTNGQDADTPPGPSISVGDPVYWSYEVTNISDVPISEIRVSDDQAVAVICPEDTLDAGQSMTCTAQGISQPGQHSNIGKVVAKDPLGNQLMAEDPSHYFGCTCGIKIKKFTNGQDADTPPGPFVLPGSKVLWTYEVSNLSNVLLSNVKVVDNQGVIVSCPQDTLEAGQSMTCTASGTAQAGQYTNSGTVTATAPDGQQLTFNDPSHYFGYTSGISIEKSTNGQDADSPPGPRIPTGSQVFWTYRITNTGNIPISNIKVVDNQIGAITCPATMLDPGQSMTCTASGIARAGQYKNIATATATDILGNQLTAEDPSHYFGYTSGINIKKSTNGQDADSPPGPSIPVGGLVTWRYVVTNTGDDTLTGITVSDDKLGLITCPKNTLGPGQSMTCEASGTAALGQYANLATVTAKDSTGNQLIDTDPSHYFGVSAGVSIKKSTNGEDANSPPGPSIPVGGLVTWSYKVTNTGNTPLSGITVYDDKLGPIACPKNSLAVGEYMTCEATGTATAGQYKNVGIVKALDTLGREFMDSDPSHYFGCTCGITIKKFTNDQHVDSPPGPSIPVGNPVYWKYEVTNTSNVTISNVTVTDSEGSTVTCPKTTLEPNESMTCEAEGTAQAGQYKNTGTATATGPGGEKLIFTDTSYYFGVASGLSFKKLTNGQDANTSPGPLIQVGDQVTWTYEVKNTGNTTLSDIKVVDDKLGEIDCPNDSLGVGESMICTATGIAQAGQYKNNGTATALDPSGNELTAEDPSCYFGVASGLSLKKLTNGQDANTTPCPEIPVGNQITWTYEVKNTGNTKLTGITVSDDKLGLITCPKTTLDQGESMTCTATGTAQAGQYKNTGTATALDPLGNELTAKDPSCYFGVSPAKPCLKLTKTINGPYRTSDNLFLTDRIIPVAVKEEIAQGSPVFYFLVEITVENCNDTPLTGVVVTDTFNNEAYPFETSDPTHVIIAPPPSPGGFEKEKLTWTVGSIPALESRTLLIKVGTEFNPAEKLEPTSAPQTIFYNGQDTNTGSAKVTTNEGLSAKVEAVRLTNGEEISCAGSVGQWDQLPWDRCSAITTPLPITLTAAASSAPQTATAAPSPRPRSLSSWKDDAYADSDYLKSLLPIWLGTPGGQQSIKISTCDQVYDILAPKQISRMSNLANLYAQVLACKLNLASGAEASVQINDSASLEELLSEIDSFLAVYSSRQWYPRLTKGQKTQIKKWLKELEDYNCGKYTP
ncbi:MAG: hypothetical protein K6U11_02140 [bacterium]|nr:hypothetical protein [bacterium]